MPFSTSCASPPDFRDTPAFLAMLLVVHSVCQPQGTSGSRVADDVLRHRSRGPQPVLLTSFAQLLPLASNIVVIRAPSSEYYPPRTRRSTASWSANSEERHPCPFLAPSGNPFCACSRRNCFCARSNAPCRPERASCRNRTRHA